MLDNPELLYAHPDEGVGFILALLPTPTPEPPLNPPPADKNPRADAPVPQPTATAAATVTPTATAAATVTPALAQVAPAPPTVVKQAPAPSSPPRTNGTLISGHATAYGPAYNGQVLGCGTGYYASDDPTIVAVSPARYGEWPCGTQLRICGPAGCIVATRQDACPGCYANLVDLSEAGNAMVCGSPPHTCVVTLQVVVVP